jgi:hypothetical protein
MPFCRFSGLILNLVVQELECSDVDEVEAATGQALNGLVLLAAVFRRLAVNEPLCRLTGPGAAVEEWFRHSKF